MMKKFTTPKIEVIKFEEADVLTLSLPFKPKTASEDDYE